MHAKHLGECRFPVCTLYLPSTMHTNYNPNLLKPTHCDMLLCLHTSTHAPPHPPTVAYLYKHTHMHAHTDTHVRWLYILKRRSGQARAVQKHSPLMSLLHYLLEWLCKKSSMDESMETDYKEVMRTCTQTDNICSYTNTKLAV